MAEINQSLLDLLNEQTRHNVQVFQTLTQPANWGKAVQLQNEFLRASLAAGSSVRPALCRGQPGRHDLSADDRARSDQESLSTGTAAGIRSKG